MAAQSGAESSADHQIQRLAPSSKAIQQSIEVQRQQQQQQQSTKWFDIPKPIVTVDHWVTWSPRLLQRASIE